MSAAGGGSARPSRHVRLPMVCPVRLSDHLVRPEEEQRRDGEAERLGGLQVEHQLEFGGLLDRQAPRLRPPKDLVYEG